MALQEVLDKLCELECALLAPTNGALLDRLREQMRTGFIEEALRLMEGDHLQAATATERRWLAGCAG